MSMIFQRRQLSRYTLVLVAIFLHDKHGPFLFSGSKLHYAIHVRTGRDKQGMRMRE